MEPLQFSEIAPATKTGIFLTTLTHETKQKEVDNVSVWTDEDANKLGNLTRRLAELEANDPIKQAAKIRTFKERVTKLRTYVEHRTISLSNERLDKLKEMIKALAAADKAVELASQSKLQDEPLPSAGERAWQILYNAAKDYSTTKAYPDLEFPVVRDKSRCVLCMQLLNEEGKQRLLRFKAFMEQATKKKQEEAKNALDSAVESIEILRDKAAADQHSNSIEEVKQLNEEAAISDGSLLG